MVKILTNKDFVAGAIEICRKENLKTGFVPTMGALHEGHLSLIKQCKKNDEACFASIFINPTQFNDPEDYKNYPRTLDIDIPMLSESGCDYVYVPEVDELYPEGTDTKISIDLGILAEVLEAKFRPGHFDGVVTVLKKLFDIVQPDTVYLGQKDYQQYLVIKKMIETFSYKIELQLCPIFREKDGLAMSSRNRRLNDPERQLAPVIFETLCKAGKMLHVNSIQVVKDWAKKKLTSSDLIDFEYFEILDAENLNTINVLKDSNKIIICTALKIGKTRLIDNIFWNSL